jgi:hypothetical protein
MFVPLDEMPASSRVWVFMCDREWLESEIELIRFAVRPFLDDWTAHQKALRSSYAIVYNRFLVLAVDEQFSSASGCSIDKSVNFIKSLELQLNCHLMNRMLFAYKKDDQVLVANKEEFERLSENGVITDDTIVFDNLVDSIHALNHRWEIPFERSWHKVLVG